MALPINTIIQRICPLLFADPGLNDWITMAAERTSAQWYGGAYNMAVSLRAAHEYTLAVTRPNGEAGQVTSMSEGGQSRSFSSAAGSGASSDALIQTKYGLSLKDLRRAQKPSAGVVTGLPQPVIPPNMDNWANW